MDELRYSPQFELKLGGSPLPADTRASVVGVTYTAGLNGADRVEVTLVNDKLRWLDDPQLALHQELTLSLGYAPDPLVHVFTGEIVSHSASFPSAAAPTLTIAALNRMNRLQEGMKARWFAVPTESYGNFPLPDPAVAGIVSAENGLIPVMEPVGATLAAL